ncbi:MAG: carboxymuconolactone decarboxylase family protein [Propionibacteriaceae bacterium]
MTTDITATLVDGQQLQARMPNPAFVVPGVYEALMAFNKAMQPSGLSTTVRELVNIRASQINGCGVCNVQHARLAKRRGEPDEKIWAIAGWRDAPYFTAAERAALALTEAITVLGQPNPVPDEVWEEAARHYDEQQLAALVLNIAMVNLWNRLNVSTRQVAGQEW